MSTVTSTKGYVGSCKCCCNLGNVIPRWENVTQVKTSTYSSVCTAPATATANGSSIPAARVDETFDSGSSGAGVCSPGGVLGFACGLCGGWLEGPGDLLAPSAQEVTDTVNDIVACGGTTIDHNCYSQTGTVDMRTSKLFGGQWILGKKFWHGVLPFTSLDQCTPNPNQPADQVRYLTISVGCNWNYRDYNGNPYSGPNYEVTTNSVGAYSGSDTVNSKTGIRTNALTMSQTDTSQYGGGTPGNPFYTTVSNTNGVGFVNSNPEVNPNTNILSNMQLQFPGGHQDQYVPPMYTYANFTCGTIPAGLIGDIYSGGFTITYFDAGGISHTLSTPAVGTVDNWTCDGDVGTYWETEGGWEYAGVSTIHAKFQRTATSVSFSINYHIFGENLSITTDYSMTFEAALSNPYTATDCYNDFLAALEKWDMSDLNVASLRTDEELANAPCCMYDENGPAAPDMLYQFTIDDWSGGLVDDASGKHPGDPGYVTTWGQRAWVDPYDYVWRASNGGFNAANIPGTGGCTLLTPQRSGQIISHNPAGSDRHFWFGFPDKERFTCAPSGSGYQWLLSAHGGYSDSILPATTLRWLDKEQAQYDANSFCEGAGGTPNVGNFPQAFYNQYGQTLIGGKYVAAVQQWPAVNRGRPCGPDKYAVDQTTVGCVEGAGSGYFKALPTGAAFPSTGYVIATGSYGTPGVYAVTGAPTATGFGFYNIPVGPKLDDIPTGWTHTTDGNFIGWLRFPTASGICGRVGITTTYSAPTLTINTVDQPYLRVGTTGSISVDLYDSTMTSLASGVALTRVNDGQFTATAGPYPTAAYMTGHGVDWTKYTTASQHTGVHLDWQFDLRAPYKTVPPTFYAGAGGCLGCNVTQFTYEQAKCLSMVGIVPFYSGPVMGSDTPTGGGSAPASTPVENFPNQVLFPMPDTVIFDSVYGAHWQGAVMLTMPDPFWQTPFSPACGATINWTEDDGSGHADDTTDVPNTLYYAHRPFVEASTDSSGLPMDYFGNQLTVTYDPANQIYPPAFANGISCDGTTGDYTNVDTDWGFANRACEDIAGSGRFYADYMQFVSC